MNWYNSSGVLNAQLVLNETANMIEYYCYDYITEESTVVNTC